jgi:dienelactone hydrolase
MRSAPTGRPSSRRGWTAATTSTPSTTDGRRRARRVVLLVAALALLGAALRFGAALAFAVGLAVPQADAWLAGLWPAPREGEIGIPVEGGRLACDVYRPPRARGALVLVHGLSRAGRRHPELVRLARLLARHDRLVLVPHFEGLAAFRLRGREVDEIEAALRHLRAQGAPSGILGFSFGAGPALLAATRVPDVRLAGSFGGYADLRDVIAYVTTGARHDTPAEPYNRWKLLALLAAFPDDPQDRGRLERLAERKLADPGADGRELAAGLGREGRAVVALVENRRPEALAAHLAALPPAVHRALDALSPLAAVARLPGRLLLAHGVHDDSIPFTESVRLAEAAGARARLALLRGFHHTGPRSLLGSLADSARDGTQLLSLADDLLDRH